MFEIKLKKVINKPINEVWIVLANQFKDAEKWATGVYKSKLYSRNEDHGRVCKTSMGVIREKITIKKKYILQYEITKGMPFFVKLALNTWSLKVISKTKTELSINLKVKTMPIIGPVMELMMKPQMNKLMPAIMNDFSKYVETGKASANKLKELALESSKK